MENVKSLPQNCQKNSKMQLSNDANISNISRKTGFAIFELPEADFTQILTNANHFHPNEKNIYTKDDIKAISEYAHAKQSDELILVLENAEKINEAAANTFLKTLEEPGEHVHFVFLVRNASEILSTIKSRAHIYYLPPENKTNEAPTINSEIMDLAKKYIACKPKELPAFCDKIAKDKKDARGKAIAIIDAAIQILYKTYFITGKTMYLKKLENLMKAADAMRVNGHIKLQLVAGML